jgi:hypothetical protein
MLWLECVPTVLVLGTVLGDGTVGRGASQEGLALEMDSRYHRSGLTLARVGVL